MYSQALGLCVSKKKKNYYIMLVGANRIDRREPLLLLYYV